MERFTEKRILSVSQLTSLIRGVLEDNFEYVWVEGEVSNIAQPSSGHLYFNLKDSFSQIRCVMFRAAARAIKFKICDGMRLVAHGRISLYEPRGDYQFLAEYLEPLGVGALHLAFSQLKDRLAAEGLFDVVHKQQLPSIPQRIGIVTSPTGAAIHDILQVLDRRFPNLEIYIMPVKVQGEGAAEEIVMAINDFNCLNNVDVLIVGRGGGPIEDLWAFNDEKVARAIFKSNIPIITAIGHEVDFTVADFVADLRAPTPSAAAELVIRSKEELFAELCLFNHRLYQGMRNRFLNYWAALNVASGALKDPATLIGHMLQRLDDLSVRLKFVILVYQKQCQNLLLSLRTRLGFSSPYAKIKLQHSLLQLLINRNNIVIADTLELANDILALNSAKLSALSPLATLNRGYSIITSFPDGKLVKNSNQVSPGARLKVIFQDGEAVSIVESVYNSKSNK